MDNANLQRLANRMDDRKATPKGAQSTARSAYYDAKSQEQRLVNEGREKAEAWCLSDDVDLEVMEKLHLLWREGGSGVARMDAIGERVRDIAPQSLRYQSGFFLRGFAEGVSVIHEAASKLMKK